MPKNIIVWDGQAVGNLRQTMAFLDSKHDVVVEVDGKLYKVQHSYSHSPDGVCRLYLQTHKLPFDTR